MFARHPNIDNNVELQHAALIAVDKYNVSTAHSKAVSELIRLDKTYHTENLQAFEAQVCDALTKLSKKGLVIRHEKSEDKGNTRYVRFTSMGVKPQLVVDTKSWEPLILFDKHGGLYCSYQNTLFKMSEV